MYRLAVVLHDSIPLCRQTQPSPDRDQTGKVGISEALLRPRTHSRLIGAIGHRYQRSVFRDGGCCPRGAHNERGERTLAGTQQVSHDVLGLRRILVRQHDEGADR